VGTRLRVWERKSTSKCRVGFCGQLRVSQSKWLINMGDILVRISAASLPTSSNTFLRLP